MEESDLSSLSYVVEAVAREPQRARELIDFSETSGRLKQFPVEKVSSSLREALNALRTAIEEEFPPRVPVAKREAALRRVAKGLLERGGPAKEAGRALAWVLENRTQGRGIAR